jgi:hypothetical protein
VPISRKKEGSSVRGDFGTFGCSTAFGRVDGGAKKQAAILAGVKAVPIHQVLHDGRIRRLGDWVPAERRLELASPGFPLLGPGSHSIDGMLPWVFWDMCPSGFLVRRFAQREQALSLGADPRTWTEHDAMRALTEAGDDLPGNLIVGEHSLERWSEARRRNEEYFALATRALAGQRDALPPGWSRTPDGKLVVGNPPWQPIDIEAWLEAGAEAPGAGSSSLGGERPKLASETPTGGVLRKFSPSLGPPVHGPPGPSQLERALPSFASQGVRFPSATPQAQRWADLLRTEAHCAATLRHFGVNAVQASAISSLTGRVVLEVVRFDRTENWGRRGATTLYWYAMARHGDVSLAAPDVVRGLVEDGYLSPSSLELASRVHAFSRAIGNNDAHLGNYGLVFEDEGQPELAPFYDILPMALAPLHDELPDERLRRRATPPPADPGLAPWIDELLRRVEADRDISPAFIELWRRIIGAT